MADEIIIKIDRHEAKATSAFTRWVMPQNAKLLYSTKGKDKTHWYEYYIVPSNSTLIRIRRSNRGNVSSTKFLAEELKIPEEELEMLKALGVAYE